MPFTLCKWSGIYDDPLTPRCVQPLSLNLRAIPQELTVQSCTPTLYSDIHTGSRICCTFVFFHCWTRHDTLLSLLSFHSMSFIPKTNSSGVGTEQTEQNQAKQKKRNPHRNVWSFGSAIGHRVDRSFNFKALKPKSNPNTLSNKSNRLKAPSNSNFCSGTSKTLDGLSWCKNQDWHTWFLSWMFLIQPDPLIHQTHQHFLYLPHLES